MNSVVFNFLCLPFFGMLRKLRSILQPPLVMVSPDSVSIVFHQENKMIECHKSSIFNLQYSLLEHFLNLLIFEMGYRGSACGAGHIADAASLAEGFDHHGLFATM